MMPVDQTIDQQQVPYISAFEHSETDLARIGHPWIHQIRRDAIERFSELGFPSAHDEDWKFTNLDPLLKISFAGRVERGPRLPAHPRRVGLRHACVAVDEDEDRDHALSAGELHVVAAQEQPHDRGQERSRWQFSAKCSSHLRMVKSWNMAMTGLTSIIGASGQAS